MKKEIKSDTFDFNKEFEPKWDKTIRGDEALAIFKKVAAGTNKKIHTDEAIFMHGSWVGTNYLEYSSGDYEVRSSYSIREDKYITQVIHYFKGAVMEVYNVKNKMAQRLLHHFVVPIKTKRMK